jgi:deoxyribodipyrimidine photo-lyase
VTIALHWFRTDLRCEDNTGLRAAQQSGKPVVGLYIATPAQWDNHDDAPIKRDFWHRNLLVLEDALQKLGIPLVCAEVDSYRDIPPLLALLLPALAASELHANREYPLNERQRDEAVASLCGKLGTGFHRHDDAVLVPPTSLLNKSRQPFKMFTPYARSMRERLQAADMRQYSMRRQQAPELPIFPQQKPVAALDFAVSKTQWAALWPAGEQHAKRQLQHFCQEKIASYRRDRDFPALQGTSEMSPYLAAGVVSVRQCWRAAGVFAEGDGVLAWQNELLWRDFYRYVMWHFPRVSKHQPWRDDVDHVPWRHDEDQFRAWCEGRTGIPIVDAAMRQLLQAGWMHNRLRMLTATFLSKHLLIDWRWGERWFMQHLVDGDFPANNGGWQWSASTGTDAVPYFRVFNPVTQSRRFDAAGNFIRRFVPELAALDDATIHDPGMLRPASYPPPMVELAFGRERALQSFKKP